MDVRSALRSLDRFTDPDEAVDFPGLDDGEDDEGETVEAEHRARGDCYRTGFGLALLFLVLAVGGVALWLWFRPRSRGTGSGAAPPPEAPPAETRPPPPGAE